MSDAKILDAHFALCESCPYCSRERSYKRDLNGTVVMLPDMCDDRLRCDREVSAMWAEGWEDRNLHLRQRDDAFSSTMLRKS